MIEPHNDEDLLPPRHHGRRQQQNGFHFADKALQPKALPHSEESERAVLAGILLEPELMHTASERLKAEDFYFEKHQLLYAAMVELDEDRAGIDLRTIQAKLEQKDQISKVGGLAYIAGLDVDLPDLGRFDSYLEIVKETSIRRRLIAAAGATIRDCLNGGLLAPQAILEAEKTLVQLGEEILTQRIYRLDEVVEEALEDLEEEGPAQKAIPSGFVDFDNLAQGLCQDNLVIIAGRPGMGKTSFALNVAQNVGIRHSRGVLIFSLEMSRHELALRALCSEGDVDFHQLRTRHLPQSGWNSLMAAARTIAGAPIYIDDSATLSMLELTAKARRMQREKGIELVMVDYLQLLSSGARHDNRQAEVAAVSRGLKALAKTLHIPVVALAQLSRKPEERGDKRPQLSDLRETGQLEQDADLVAFLYRDEVYNKNNPENTGLAELIVAKHRNGPTGTIDLVFLGESTTFRNRARTETR